MLHLTEQQQKFIQLSVYSLSTVMISKQIIKQKHYKFRWLKTEVYSWAISKLSEPNFLDGRPANTYLENINSIVQKIFPSI